MKKIVIGLFTITIVVFLFSACGGSKNDTQAQPRGDGQQGIEEMGELQGDGAEEEGIDTLEEPAQPSVKLRSEYQNVAQSEAEEMVKRLGFHAQNANLKPYGKFVHQYEVQNFNGDKVVVDHVTGLMWHPSGSDRTIHYAEIESWLADLNTHAYAGFSDWRLPTLEEAASLLESSKKNSSLYIDPLFSAKQQDIWTGDVLAYNLKALDNEGNEIGPNPPAQWIVAFWNAGMYPNNRNADYSLRPVRSL